MDPATIAAALKLADITASFITRRLDNLGNANTDRTIRNHEIALAVEEAKAEIRKIAAEAEKESTE